MKSLLKWIFGITLSVVLLAGIGIAILLFAVNPNSFKPQIEQLALNNGLTLQIRGDLNWQILPNIAITVGETHLSGKDLPQVQFQQADLALDLGKLIGGDIAINKIAIANPLIRLEINDSSAAGQATAIAAAPIAAAQETVIEAGPESTGNQPMTLAISSLELQNGTVELLQGGVVQQRFENLNISSRQVNLKQAPFPLSVELTTSVTDIAEQVALRLTADITADSNIQKLSVDNGALNANIESNDYGNHNLSANFTTTVDLLAGTLNLPNAAIKLDDVPLQLNARITSLMQTPDIQGTLEIPAFAPQPLLQSFSVDPSVLPAKQLSLKTGLTSKGDTHNLSGLTLTMDDFTLTGDVYATLSGQREIKALLKGTALNLDSYLAPGEEKPADQQPEALFAPLLAPLAALDGGKGQVEINLAQLTTQGVQLNNIHVNAFGNGKVIRVANASASGFGGTVKSDARIDLAATPKLTFNLAASSVDIGQALAKLADFQELSGNGDLAFSGSSSGNTSDDLVANLKGSGSFQLADPAYSALNIEQQFCAVAGDKDQQPATWPEGSRFDNAQSNFSLDGQMLTLTQLNTGVGNLKLRGSGNMALLDGVMDMRVVFNINGAKSSEQGCVLRSKSIQNRDIPIRLRGSIDNMNSMIRDALVDLIAKMVIERKADQLLDKLLGGDKKEEQDPNSEQPKDSKEQVKDLLKDLLKKR